MVAFSGASVAVLWLDCQQGLSYFIVAVELGFVDKVVQSCAAVARLWLAEHRLNRVELRRIAHVENRCDV